MNLNPNRIFTLSALIAGMAMFSADMHAQAKDTLKVGVALPLTGSGAGFGNDLLKGAQWAVDDINAKGGVNGKHLEVIPVDTQADPQVGISAVKRMIAVNQVPVFLVAWSSVVKAVAPIANREKILELNFAANSPEIAQLGDYVYSTFPFADVDIKALANYSHSTLGAKTAAVVYVNNDSGVEGAAIYKNVFEKAGGKIVAYEAYDPKATDHTGVLLKLRVANPDIVHIQGLVADMPQVLAQMRQLGLKQRVSTYSIGYNPAMIAQLGAASEGLIVTSLAPSATDNPNVRGFIERWKTAEKRMPNGLSYTQYSYDSAYLVAELYRWVDKNKVPATGENLRKALLAIRTFDLPMTGSFQVRDDKRAEKPIYLLNVVKGQFTPLATIK